METHRVESSYDRLPYPSYAYPQTHPDRLQTLSQLLKFNGPKPGASFNLLELGCAAGGNIIPMALQFPECRFWGIDSSRRQIDEGNRLCAQLELSNLQLACIDIFDFVEDHGSFDFVICHGVYSWVPAAVQQRILTIFRDCLRDNGIGYISYNTLPGWRQRGVVREMMQYHVQRTPASSPQDQVKNARDLLEFLNQALIQDSSAFAMLLREQHQLLKQCADSYIFHEHLEECNEPLWFLEFCERLSQCNLRYLADAEFGTMVATTSFPAAINQQLEALAPALLDKEQYMDFIRNRSFRQTLVCHADHRPDYDVKAERLNELFVASPAQKVSNPSASDGLSQFATDDGTTVTTPHSSTSIAFEILSEIWPSRIPARDLFKQTLGRLTCLNETIQECDVIDQLERSLLSAYTSSHGRLLELSVYPLEVGNSSELPQVSRFNRIQSRSGKPVVNRRHEPVTVLPIDRRILPLLDGEHDPERILEALMVQFNDGDLQVQDADGTSILDLANVRQLIQHIIPERIQYLARNSMLHSRF